MPRKITVMGREVTVDDSWDSLTPDQKEQTVNEIYRNMQAAGEKFGVDKQMEDWSRRHPIASKAATMLQGIPFAGEYVDEALGRLSGRGQEGVDMVRTMQEREQRENPGQSLALQMGGGVAATAPLAGAGALGKIANMAPATTTGRVFAGGGAGMVLGAGEGAVSGYGSGTTPEERWNNAIERSKVGALMGLGAGGATPLTASIAKRGTQALSDEFTTNARAKAIGMSPQSAFMIGRAIPDPNVAKYNIQRAGSDAMLADAGPSAQNALDSALSRSSGAIELARPSIEQRARRATGKMNAALDVTMGSPKNVNTAIREIKQGTRQARADAYRAAYDSPIDYASQNGIELEGLMRRVPKEAIDEANRLMQIMGEQSKQIIADVADDGTITFRRMPDVRQWDYITRALQTVEQGQKGLAGQTPTGLAYGELKREIRGRLKDAVPEYRKALATAQDPLSEIEALQVGESALRPSVKRGDFLLELQDMTPAQRSAARRGARQYIDDTISRVTSTLTDDAADIREGQRLLKDLSSRQNKEKLQALLGDKQANQLFAVMEENAAAFRLRASIAQNSKTAQRTEFNDALKEQAEGGVLDALDRGEFVNSGKQVIQMLTGSTPAATRERMDSISREIAQKLTTVRGPDALRLLDALSQIKRRQPLNDQLASDVGRIMGYTTAVPGYQYGSQYIGNKQTPAQ